MAVSSGFDDALLVPFVQIPSMLVGCYGGNNAAAAGIVVGVVVVSTIKGVFTHKLWQCSCRSYGASIETYRSCFSSVDSVSCLSAMFIIRLM